MLLRRKVFILSDGKWEPIDFKDLKKDQIFIILETDGIPIGVYKAKENPVLNNEVSFNYYSVNAESLIEDINNRYFHEMG